MAKKQEMTIEQRLEEALVLYEKTPYKLPPNWCWTSLGTVCKLDNGEKSDKEELFYLDVKTLRTQNYENTKNNGVIVKEGQRVILVDGENSGEVFDIPKRGYMGSTFRILDIDKTLKEIYVRYFILSHQDELRNNKIGSAIPHLNKELFFNLSFPLAPFEEQERIVEIIEKQFAKLDEARDLIQKSLDTFADRKSALLHKAFIGELTQKWRNNKNSEWKKLTLNDVADYKKGPFGSSITKSMFVPKDISTYKVYEQGNAIRKTINYGNYYINEQKFQQLRSFEVKGGDIIVSCAGTIGETFQLPLNCEKGIINQALMRVRLYPNINDRYFIYYFGEVLKGDVNANAKGIAIKNIPRFSVLKAMKIDLPSLEEQEEIVRILDSIFEKEDKSKELIDMLDKIDEMKKSILARAFRGELGTSNTADEPAVDLLRRILENQ